MPPSSAHHVGFVKYIIIPKPHWAHIQDGCVGGQCWAGVYRVTVTYKGRHYTHLLTDDPLTTTTPNQ